MFHLPFNVGIGVARHSVFVLFNNSNVELPLENGRNEENTRVFNSQDTKHCTGNFRKSYEFHVLVCFQAHLPQYKDLMRFRVM